MNVTIMLSTEDRALIQKLVAALEKKNFKGLADISPESFPTEADKDWETVEKELAEEVAARAVNSVERVRHYTVPEIGRAGAALNDQGLLGPDFFKDVMKGKNLSDLSQDELDSIAEIFIEKGAVI